VLGERENLIYTIRAAAAQVQKGWSQLSVAFVLPGLVLVQRSVCERERERLVGRMGEGYTATYSCGKLSRPQLCKQHQEDDSLARAAFFFILPRPHFIYFFAFLWPAAVPFSSAHTKPFCHSSIRVSMSTDSSGVIDYNFCKSLMISLYTTNCIKTFGSAGCQEKMDPIICLQYRK
jgi:hypothetical protein